MARRRTARRKTSSGTLLTIGVVIVIGAIASACGDGGASTGQGSSASPVPPSSASPSMSQDHKRHPHHAAAAPHHRAAGGLLAVHDPGRVTGTLAGPCLTRAGARLPDRSCTPGAVDPAVTQATIGSTICVRRYTQKVRPPESQTEAFKWDTAVPAYGQSHIGGELDHLVPLELGGANDAANLWVEKGAIPNPKDQVENALHARVCGGEMTLRRAQEMIARNWLRAAAWLGLPASRPSSTPVPAPAPSHSRSAPQPSPAQCHPVTSSGNCYEPGEFCPQADQGMQGVAGDGKTITCEEDNGLRWVAK